MEPFRSVRGGGARAWLAAAEASLLRNLVGQIMTLIDPESGDPLSGEPLSSDPPSSASKTSKTGKASKAGKTSSTGTPDDLDALEAMLYPPGAAHTPEDPVLARLLPDAYSDDPEAAGEFRKYTESSLREAKKYFAQTMLETLPPGGGRVKLSADQARDWLRALNDVRLMFGVRLEVTEDFKEQLAALDPKDPGLAAVGGFRW